MKRSPKNVKMSFIFGPFLFNFWYYIPELALFCPILILGLFRPLFKKFFENHAVETKIRCSNRDNGNVLTTVFCWHWNYFCVQFCVLHPPIFEENDVLESRFSAARHNLLGSTKRSRFEFIFQHLEVKLK